MSDKYNKQNGYGFLDKNIMNCIQEKIVNENMIEYNFTNRLNQYIYSVYEVIADISKPKGVITDYIIANYVLMHKSFGYKIVSEIGI
ncbi:hypothetical protein [Anaerovorax odorimutans]|uniref:hypothetical protein n=1 Tax=Anaerovorax odorimutans TaxID=109327 RepID=UPI0004075622|nr:hypothetical protein [Anaerovorax odorimutans]